MNLTTETANLGLIKISKHVVKHFGKLCSGDMDKATQMAKSILASENIERLEVPAMFASLMASKGDNPDALEFWVHRDSSTIFLVKPTENYKLVEMAMKQSMSGFQFDSA